jgi:hypothetical protein
MKMAVLNSFEIDPEGWCPFEYHASIVAGSDCFVLIM